MVSELESLQGFGAPPPGTRPGAGSIETVEEDLDVRFQGAASAAGVIEIVAGPLAAGESWYIDRAAISTTSVLLSEFRAFTGSRASADARDLIDGSAGGNLDVMDTPAPWRVLPRQFLTMRWTNATAGSLGSIHLQGRRIVRSGGR